MQYLFWSGVLILGQRADTHMRGWSLSLCRSTTWVKIGLYIALSLCSVVLSRKNGKNNYRHSQLHHTLILRENEGCHQNPRKILMKNMYLHVYLGLLGRIIHEILFSWRFCSLPYPLYKTDFSSNSLKHDQNPILRAVLESARHKDSNGVPFYYFWMLHFPQKSEFPFKRKVNVDFSGKYIRVHIF